MARFDAFLGPFNTSVSPNITSELTMNWIPEKDAVPVQGMGTDVTDKNVRCSLIRTPGLATFVELPLAPVRCLWPGENRLFAVGGDHFYEVAADGTITDRSTPGFANASGVGPSGGPIGNDGRPVQIFANGNQTLLISAGKAYCDNGNGPVPVQYSDPLTDLLIDPTYPNSTNPDGRALTNATKNLFDASDIGRTVYITGGSGFNVGLSQVILSITAQGSAIGSAPWGAPGAGLGTGLEYKSISYTDLQLTQPYIVHSPSRVFSASEIGAPITITAGTGWIPGNYTISGLTYNILGQPTGDAVIFPNAGVAGATGGVGVLDDMPLTASQGAFLDGYGFVSPSPPTKTIYYSAINDFTSWNPLNFFQKEAYPDNVASLFADHQELYAMGDLQSTQVYRDTGAQPVPFSPDPGSIMHLGCQAPFSVVRLGNGVAWIGEDVTRGTRRAYHAVGYNPIAVSTPAVEAAWAQYSSVSDAVAFNMMDQGHECWIITFPTANATWAYDASTGWWHQRGWWNSTTVGQDRIRPWVHCVVKLDTIDLHYGGDWQTSQIYVIGWNYMTDDGNVIWRSRRAPQLTVENMRRFYSRFEIDCDRLGQKRLFWNRLGTGRDRIWQLESSQVTETGGVTLILSFSDDRTQTWQRMFSQYVDPGVDVRLSNCYLNYSDASWH
jgi:hypothetical protein